jgi:diguanylate cyclase (GGDEF)-like protein
MISLKKYLDATDAGSHANGEPEEEELLPAVLAAYRSSLLEVGNYSLDACPGLGKELKTSLTKLGEKLTSDVSPKKIEATEKCVREQLQEWGGRAATHYRQKAGEVKEILLVMAHTAESVGAKDQRCAQQITDVTTRLQSIADLEDLSQIRASIERSAGELKSSIDRMTAEGKAVIEKLRNEVTTFQTRLEEAEHLATCDSLTGLRSRHSVESQMETRMGGTQPFCVAILDIDGFKPVNDEHGHMVGDELLRLFAEELKSRCRTTDIVGRWGGDEFIVLLDCGMGVARGQADRIKEWVCGNYTVHGTQGAMKLHVDASIGVAEYFHGESMKALLARADAEMYRNKAASRTSATLSRR